MSERETSLLDELARISLKDVALRLAQSERRVESLVDILLHVRAWAERRGEQEVIAFLERYRHDE